MVAERENKFRDLSMKHTPGPWFAEPEEASDGRGIAIVAPGAGWIVATITPDEDREAEGKEREPCEKHSK